MRFNPRSRAGSDPVGGTIDAVIQGFNPRSRAGSDLTRVYESQVSTMFQSTLPRGERHLVIIIFISSLLCFNPRSRAGSDSTPDLDVEFDGVSIHAPARGATDYCDAQYANAQSFNPRSRAGSDIILQKVIIEQIKVSIHAPARGATTHLPSQIQQMTDVSIHAPARGATRVQTLTSDKLDSVSIHAPARGATPAPGPPFDVTSMFQSTLPRGERLRTMRSMPISL